MQLWLQNEKGVGVGMAIYQRDRDLYGRVCRAD